MTRARTEQIDLNTTPYYHCINRCVRRAFLCGVDRESGQNYEHRKQWIVDKVKQLSNIFALDVCAYAVMSNHYHLVLRVNLSEANDWSDQDVAERWCRLFKGHMLVSRWLAGLADASESSKALEMVAKWRKRLVDISWFMRCLNESIARQANEEDGCKGRFWEGRFKSRALLDEAALLTCMSYVDLNPIHAGLADTPEASDFTSIQERIRGMAAAPSDSAEASEKSLTPFNDQTENTNESIPYAFSDYIALVDWIGRAVRDDKRGSIPEHAPPILKRLQVDPAQWLDTLKHFESRFPRAAARWERLQHYALEMGLSHIKGYSGGRALSPVI